MVNDKKNMLEALKEYIHAVAMEKESIEEIARIERKSKTIENDSVKGSMSCFPWTAKNFHIEGIAYDAEDDKKLEEQKAILRERALISGEIRLKVDRYMNRIPPKMQRIIKYKLFEGNTWEDAATRMGSKSGESLRKDFKKFIGSDDIQI